MDEENKNPDNKTHKLLEELRVQASLIVDGVRYVDEEMCALVIIGTKWKTVTAAHSRPATRMVMTAVNAFVENRDLLEAMDIAVEVAKDYIGGFKNILEKYGCTPGNKEDRP